MRLILTILLIGLLKADAQMVINASRPYVPLGITPILDSYSGASYAYSIRKVRTAYTGSAIRVRKDTTGQPEQDIGFTGSGDLDTAALKSFLNARNGLVVTWYDQSGNARNATQATAASQPRIANLGVIERRQGKVAIYFNGDILVNSTTGYEVNSTHHYAVTSRDLSSASNQVVYSTGILDVTPRGFGFYFTANNASPASALVQQARNANVTVVNVGFYTNTINVSNMIYGITSNTSDSSYFNGGNLQTAAHSRSVFVTGGTLNIGARQGGFNPLNGSVSEIIRWSTANAPNRDVVFANVNSYYNIW